MTWYRKATLEHPQIMVGGIRRTHLRTGPRCRSAIRVGSEIEEDLAKLFSGSGGGGSITESYELPDSWPSTPHRLPREARVSPATFSSSATQFAYLSVKRGEVERSSATATQADIPVEESIAQLQRRYDAYYIIPR